MQLANIRDVNFIVLSGNSKTGKTTTLNELIISLINEKKLMWEKLKLLKKILKKLKLILIINNEELKSYLERVENQKKQKK